MKNYFYKILAVVFFFATVSCKKDVPVTGVSLEPATLTLEIDSAATLNATVLPGNATTKVVNWTSSNPDVATVSNGTVTAKKVGIATIIVTTQEGNFTAKCEVTVTSVEPEEPEIDWVEINGVKWAKYNLASHGKFVEKPEDFGALFQWGRIGDGHEQRSSPKYPTNNNSWENGAVNGTELDANGQIEKTHEAYGKFIKHRELPRDWRSPGDDALWNRGTEATPIKTANDPCPTGWRVPTRKELQSLIESGNEWKDDFNGVSGCIFGNATNYIFLPEASYRNNVGGEVFGWHGYYWSSSVYGWYSYCLNLYGWDMEISIEERGKGFSVRCVAE